MLQVKKPVLAFTANAFVHCLQTYGENLFRLLEKYGKFYVSEWHLCGHREITHAHLDEEWVKPILTHWFDLIDPPPFGETDEITILSKLNDLHPDNVLVVVDKLREYSRLNRVYSNDELITTEDIGTMLGETWGVV